MPRSMSSYRSVQEYREALVDKVQNHVMVDTLKAYKQTDMQISFADRHMLFEPDSMQMPSSSSSLLVRSWERCLGQALGFTLKHCSGMYVHGLTALNQYTGQ
jgi:hypothetical protein